MSMERIYEIPASVSVRYGPFSQYTQAPQPYLRSNTCTHVAPDACPSCDGTEWWKSARIPEAIPPCLMGGNTETKEGVA
jgi:hypothetical protein